jgi:hypothetical protein
MEDTVMKKVLTLIMVVVAVVTMSLTVFAALSPVSVGEWKVTAGSYATGKLGPANYKVNDDGTVTFYKAQNSDYTFEGWKVTGKYEVVSGNKMSAEYTIRPLSDLRVIEMYDCAAAGDEDENPTSPETGSNLLALGTVLLLSLSVAFVAKKRLA